MVQKIFINLLVIVSLTVMLLGRWLTHSFGYIGVDSVIYTITAPASGFDCSYITSYLKYAAPFYLVFEVLWFVYFGIRKDYLPGKIGVMIALCLFVISLICFNRRYNFVEYFISLTKKTDIYDNSEIYRNPEEVEITVEDTNNLLIIYLESMENTYMDKENGGYSDNNYIPELTELAKENISFSNNEKCGGPLNAPGTTWTIGAMTAVMSGIPLREQYFENIFTVDPFMPDSVMIGDILEENGYIMEYLLGEDSHFAGADKLYEGHGNFNVYDITDIEKDYEIKDEDRCAWGTLDYFTLNVAKERITEISNSAEKKNRRFCYVIETMDCHSPDGYSCKYCEDKYEDGYLNVVSCQSKQIYEFVEWCKTQKWYENTTIVILGDHTVGATKHTGNMPEGYVRTAYNCFINSKTTPSTVNSRQFTRFDYYPTILSAVGFKVNGDKLALGTDLFSFTKTVTETYGYDYLEEELNKKNNEFFERIKHRK